MAYLSPFYTPHFSRDLSDVPPPLHDANAFIMPERLYHPHRITTSNTWSILTDSPPTVTPEQRTEQAYRSFQSDCYSAAPGTPTPNHFPAHKEAEWWPPRLRRGHRDRSQVALVLGWLCLFLLAAMAFAICWVVGYQTAQGWVFSHLASAAHWALEALKKAFRKAWSAVRFGLRRLSSISKTAMAWLQEFFRYVAPRARISSRHLRTEHTVLPGWVGLDAQCQPSSLPGVASLRALAP
ncbi:hypothetical protein F5X68DRAFT_72653 [Plectosphaerella plurivora]|uniref:Uncharacterized protein n=1 Tax=Plectosphaerella plurivora TaxID=936078 RepID=A0A9P8UQ45_9PEZI|nr:hypothetical protein F5X68DRAFT_72653 [Plectosphaerella plurivora]